MMKRLIRMKRMTKNSNSNDEKVDKDEKEKKSEERSYQEGKPIPASPTVRRRARELGIDLEGIAGSGPGGRIMPEDVEKHGSMVSGEKKEPGYISSDEDLPDFSKWGEIERTSMSGIRRVTARNVTRAWTTVPQVTQFDRADITQLELFRKKYSKIVSDRGGRLTVTSIILKVCAEALIKFPQFNASLDISKKEIIYKKYVNIGVAVDTDRGLIVPVLKNADTKGILEISVELTELAEKARNKKISPDELQGGNITISNLGGIGGTNFTPIVYAPQAAILGIARADMEQLYTGKEFEPRLVIPLSLSYDHRLIDGADGVRFLRWIAQSLENPFTLVF
jgi:pyruvate dehydrogenase E2 component (dihydrolipoamide acetyltransferase)